MKKTLSILALTLSLTSFSQTVLDSIVSEDIIGNEHSKQYFKYLPNSILISEWEIQDYYELLGTYITDEKETMTYNSLGLLETKLTLERDAPQDPLINNSKIVMTYHPNGKQSEWIISLWSKNLKAWESHFKRTYQYNSSDQITVYSEYRYDYTNKIWEAAYSTEYTYNNGVLISTHEKINDKKGDYYYNQDGNLTSTEYSGNLYGNYIVGLRHEYTYGAITDSIYKITTYGDTADLSRPTFIKYSNYDNYGNLSSYGARHADQYQQPTKWVIHDSAAFTFNNNHSYSGSVPAYIDQQPKNILTDEAIYRWNDSISEFYKIRASTFHYSDGKGNPTVGVKTQTINFKRELVRVVDVLGREVTPTPNTVLFYIYSDGTIEKILQIK